MTQDQILAIVKAQGQFRVGWRRRDARTRRLCKLLVKRGLLYYVRTSKELIYRASD